MKLSQINEGYSIASELLQIVKRSLDSMFSSWMLCLQSIIMSLHSTKMICRTRDPLAVKRERLGGRGFRLVLKPSLSGYVHNSNNDLEKEKCICYLYGLGGRTVYACKYGTNWCLKYGTKYRKQKFCEGTQNIFARECKSFARERKYL